MPRYFDPFYAATLLGAAAGATALLIRILHPWLVRYAMARPNARSSHTTPTPQGGGIAVMLVVATVICCCALLGVSGYREPWVASLLMGLGALALAGAVDDVEPLPVLPRLLLQLGVAGLFVYTLPGGGRLFPVAPPFAESLLLVLALVWFINLTNFMDGIDWMTVVEVVPIVACLAVLGVLGIVRELTGLVPVTLALLGGMLGFAPFNRHVAKLFLGDVGSLPVGALVGWLLIVLAQSGHVVAALILPLYYVADATITLFRRWRAGDNISQAHRSHFYQRAVARGFGVPQVTGEVLVLNLLLAGLAVGSILLPSPLSRLVCLGAAVLATLVLLRRFERGAGA